MPNENSLSFESPTRATIACRNGHILLVHLTHPEEKYRADYNDIINAQETLPMNVFPMAEALRGAGYKEVEFGDHRAFTDGTPYEAPVEPVDPATVTGAVPEDNNTQPEQTPAPSPATNATTDYEALTDDELNAVAIAEGIDLDGKSRDDVVLALMMKADEPKENQ